MTGTAVILTMMTAIAAVGLAMYATHTGVFERGQPRPPGHPLAGRTKVPGGRHPGLTKN